MEENASNICRRERFQFTMGEMLLTLLASFFGMALLIPIMFREDRVLGCVIVECVTIVCAFISLKCTRVNTPRRGTFIFLAAAVGWILILLGPVFATETFLVFVIVSGFVLSPTVIAAVVMYHNRREAEHSNRRSLNILAPLFVCIPMSVLLALVILPSLFRSRMHPCEIPAASCCKAYAEAQEIYHRTDYTGNGVLKYSQHLSGNDSLLENYAGAGDLGLIDKAFGNAEIGNPTTAPKAGYVFKILKSQGPNATGGRRSYLDENGDMRFGYALVARPEPFEAGKDTFMINGNGTIFQADLGPNTVAIVDQMTEFDPDPRWQPTQ